MMSFRLSFITHGQLLTEIQRISHLFPILEEIMNNLNLG